MGLYRLLKRMERRQRWQQRQPPQSQVDVKSYTIASGAITLTGYAAIQHAKIDTEGAAATDDLNTINAGNFPTGGILWLKTTAVTRDVTLKDNADNLRLEGDMILDNTRDTILLGYIGSDVWQELSRSNNE